MKELLLIALQWLPERIVMGFFLVKLLTSRFGFGKTVFLFTFFSEIFLVLVFPIYYTVYRGPIQMVFMALFILFVFKEKLLQKLKIFILFYVISFATEMMCLGFYFLLSGTTQVAVSSPEQRIVTMFSTVIFSVLTVLIVTLIKRIKGYELYLVIGMILLLALSQLMFLMSVFISSKNFISENLLFLTMLAVMPAVIVNIFSSEAISKIVNISEQKKALEFAEQKNAQEYEYYLMAMENEQRMSTLRHDLNNQLQSAYVLIESGEKEKGLSLMGELTHFQQTAKPLVLCENAIVNTVLSIKRKKSEENGIGMDIKVKSKLNNIKLSDMELSSVLTNLLDNAIQGCLDSGQSSKTILVSIGEKQGYMVISIANTSRQFNNAIEITSLKTNKSEKNNHGYGLKIVSSICKKHGGDIAFSYKEGVFQTTATFLF